MCMCMYIYIYTYIYIQSEDTIPLRYSISGVARAGVTGCIYIYIYIYIMCACVYVSDCGLAPNPFPLTDRPLEFSCRRGPGWCDGAGRSFDTGWA